MLYNVHISGCWCNLLPIGVRGVHPLWGHDAFPTLFQISPLFSKNFQSLWKILKMLPFEFPLCFPCFSTFPSPISQKLLFPSTFKNFPVLEKFTCFLHTLCVFRFPPYFDHAAFMPTPNARIGRLCLPSISLAVATINTSHHNLDSKLEISTAFWLSTCLTIVIVNSRFLERPQKRSRRN